ncbi:hypothetical protein PILCRDRAFT_341396 [Piloderma croceum F 1598]|uniref:C2H2-type domain-containing protein n=1 Tax=Piloderma croceum (strain F 1598) TaxID=765440 RepID=A0A0C3FP75_PILCF|nr:hypothetical protein PILCRDRAFT_341396 [Piloderma croceum F 1598]
MYTVGPDTDNCINPSSFCLPGKAELYWQPACPASSPQIMASQTVDLQRDLWVSGGSSSAVSNLIDYNHSPFARIDNTIVGSDALSNWTYEEMYGALCCESPFSISSGTVIDSSLQSTMLGIPTDDSSFGAVDALRCSSSPNKSNLFDFPCFLNLDNRSSIGVFTDSPVPSTSPLCTGDGPSNPHTLSSSTSPLLFVDSIPSNLTADGAPSEKAYSDHSRPRRVRCLETGCNRYFTNKYTLKLHMRSHKAKPRVRLPCTFGCSECFSRSHDRLRHEVTQHGKVCEFVCDHCRRFFSSKNTLENHKCPAARGRTRWAK